MHLDVRNVDRSQCVTQGDAGVRVGGRVDDDEINAFRGSRLDPVNELTFMVALERFEQNPVRLRAGVIGGVNVAQRGTSLRSRLARAEKVQIGTVQYQNLTVGRRGAG